MDELEHVKRAHFIGIGGVSMSALAHALFDRGTAVTGSDIRESDRISVLRDLGIEVNIGHDSQNVGEADLVVFTTAIPDDNPELKEARARRIPTWHRSKLLATFVRNQRALAVTGTHGKTTTTAMLGYILTEAGFDPTIFLGGISRDFQSNYRVGDGDIVVFEADESDASFHQYRGTWQIITNIEADHLDQHDTFETLRGVFSDFISMGDPEGYLVYGADSAPLAAMAGEAPGEAVGFALESDGQFRAVDIEIHECTTHYDLIVEGTFAGRCSLSTPGRHYVEDALAAIAMARCVGVDPAESGAILEGFQGTGRRFEPRHRSEKIQVYDDYAHHPTEVRAVIRAAREAFKGAHITVAFQPHLYSRTRDFMDEFARALAGADAVVVNGIYGAREDPLPGVSGADLAERVREIEPARPVSYIPKIDALAQELLQRVPETDVIITVGAGDITEVSHTLARLLEERG